MDRSGVRKVPEGCGEQRKMEETDCEVICDAPTTLVIMELVEMINKCIDMTLNWLRPAIIMWADTLTTVIVTLHVII